MKGNILGSHEIHLWYQRLDPTLSPDILGKYLEALPGEEQEQHKQLISTQKKLEYLMTRTLVRQVLSQYVDVPPGQWKFSKTSQGRPEIFHPRLGFPIQFNLSHCVGLVVCAVGLNCDLGVDIECIKGSRDLMKVAKTAFSKEEFKALTKLSEGLQVQRFYQCWTLREAYLKAQGKGLSSAPQDFSFHFKKGDHIQISIDKKLDKNPEAWQFKSIQFANYQLALAIRRKAEGHFKVIETWNQSAA